MDKRILVGKFGAAQGVRGEVRLFAYLDDPGLVKNLGVLEDKTGARKFKIISSRPAKDFLVVKVEDIEDRDAAAKLTHIELFVPRERLPKPKGKKSFYYSDLIGLSVEDKAGKNLGMVAAVQNYGAGDLLEIKPASAAETFLLPFADHFVPVVDIEGGRVVVELPEKFFERGEEEPPRSAR